ncbi:hypothetical protein R6Q59_034906 [Mikania micrantha]
MLKKSKRGASKCKKKFLDPTQFKIEFDETGQAIGKNQAIFNSWVGVECRKRIPYHKLAKDVDKKIYDDIWEYTKESWNIPDDKAKEVTLRKGKASMRSFRHELVKKYVEKNKTPFLIYDHLDKQHWDSFVSHASTTEFKEKGQKASINARKNIEPARVGRGGFSRLKPLYKSRWKQLVSTYPHLAKIQNEHSRMYAVSRAHLNPQTNLYELGNHLQSEGILTGTIEELYSKEKEMMADGSYYEPGKDVVTEVVGKGRQHGGRTRLFSSLIGVRDSLFLELKTKKKKGLVSNSTVEESPLSQDSSHAPNSCYYNLPEIKSVKKCELLWPFDQDHQNKVLATGLVYPTAERSIHGFLMKEGFVKVQVDRVKENCKMLHVLPETRIEGEVERMEDTEGCFIQWPRKSLNILNTNSHGQSLITQVQSVSTPDCRPQSIQQVRQSTNTHAMPELKESPNCHPPSMPSKDEIQELQRYTMALHDDQAFVDLLNDNLPYSNPVESDHVCPPYKTASASVPKIKNEKVAKLLKDAEKSRPLSVYKIAQQLVFMSNETTYIIATSPLGMYQEPFTERVEIEAVIQLCVNGWVDICFMHYFSMYLYTIGRNAGLNQTAYFNPRFIEGTMLLTEKRNVINHIINVISFEKNKRWFLAPHLVGGHWILILLHCHPKDKSWKGHIFDSLGKGKNPSYYVLKDIIDEAIDQKITWNMVNCRQQANGWECGYCVMMTMYDFVINCREHLLIDNCSLVSQEEVDAFIERTLNGFVSTFVED